MQEPMSPERTVDAEPFSVTLRRCFHTYASYEAPAGTVPAFRLQRETYADSPIIDISVTPYNWRDGLHRDRLGGATIDEDRHPARLLTEFANTAQSMDEVFAVADVFTSDEFQNANQKSDYFLNDDSRAAIISATKWRITAQAADLVARGGDAPEKFLGELFTRLQDEASAERILSLVRYFEGSFKKRLIAGTYTPAPTREEVDNIAQVVWAMEQEGQLMDHNEDSSILAVPKILVQPPFAELMIARLRERPAYTDRKGEMHSRLTARLVIKEVLLRYGKDITRHEGNVSVIKKQLFPEEGRVDSLSRGRMIALANAITTSENKHVPGDKQQALLDPDNSGILGEALRRVLAVTSANDATSEQAESHRLEDRLYSELISMMLEQRQIQALESQG